jgi:hypothetical protein
MAWTVPPCRRIGPTNSRTSAFRPSASNAGGSFLSSIRGPEPSSVRSISGRRTARSGFGDWFPEGGVFDGT